MHRFPKKKERQCLSEIGPVHRALSGRLFERRIVAGPISSAQICVRVASVPTYFSCPRTL
jgi:hypothetical protein